MIVRIPHVADSLLALLACSCLLTAASPLAAVEGASTSGARNVILVIPDGSQLAHQIAVSRYLTGRDDGLAQDAFPYRAYATTWALDTYNAHARTAGSGSFPGDGFDPELGYRSRLAGTAPYPVEPSTLERERYFMAHATDSAAAGTAIATGIKTDNGNLSWASGDRPDGALSSIAELARRQHGMAIGVVSSVQFLHATPASFVSHSVSRHHYAAISDEIVLTTRPEVVIGAGHPDPDGDGEASFGSDGGACTISAASYAALSDGSAGYLLVERDGGEDAGARLLAAAHEAAGTGRRLFGLFGGARVGGNQFTPPIPLHRPGEPGFTLDRSDPSLADCAEAAIEVLAQDEEGFFLMIEGGDIDWANHGDDFTGMIGCWQQTDAAVRRVVELIESGRYPKLGPENTLLVVLSDHGNGLMRLAPGYASAAGELPRWIDCPLEADYLEHFPSDAQVVYPEGGSFGGHTNELVTVHAYGAGTGHLARYEGHFHPGTRLLDHTLVFYAMCDHLGIDPGHRPPQPAR